MNDFVVSLRLKIKELEKQNKKLCFENSCLKIDNDKLNKLLKDYQKHIPLHIQEDLF